jgi:carbonic anhydrase
MSELNETIHEHETVGTVITADEALHRLIDGNARFLRGESRFAGMRPEMLAELSKGQQPFATVLGCADSRVPPELIFDAILGELFVVRVAGNVLSPEVAGSFQYAGVHLRTPLFVVLGHEGCGAIQAALESRFLGIQHRSRIQILLDSIMPALQDVDAALPPYEQLARAVEANVRWTMRQILESPEGKARVAAGEYKLVGAVYDIASGRVRFLESD